MKPVVTRNLMLDFIPPIVEPKEVNGGRLFALNNFVSNDFSSDDLNINKGKVIYFISREYRLEDNWGMLFAKSVSEKYSLELEIQIFEGKQHSAVQEKLFFEGIENLKENLLKNNIKFKTVQALNAENAAFLIVDFNPVEKINFENINCPPFPLFPIFEVDSHNIIPARFISNKQEFSAATLRRKVYTHIGEFLTEFPSQFPSQFPSFFKIKKSQAYSVLEDFIENKLEKYVEFKNNPNVDAVSNLSPYLHFGHISSQRVALEILKSKASRENKEAFLEELIVRKELSDNFCLYSEDYKSLKSVLPWAKETLEAHREDLRTYIYFPFEFENAKTHDELWNAAQKQLLKTGKIHGFMRMYWAKKILEWSKSPKEALEIAIYLNDTYAVDGIDPNGYVGILWSIAGLHDRPFSNRLVTGKIRYMSKDGCRKKFDIEKYIAQNP